MHTLRRNFLAAFPVIGPHAYIEAELMLSGKKPLTWVFVEADDAQFKDLAVQKRHEGRKLMDRAVEQGTLVAVDVEQRHPDYPEQVATFRHYAQPDYQDDLKRVAEFNRQAFNFGDLEKVCLDRDIGFYLGYKKRDVLFFNNVVNSKILPDFVKRIATRLNVPCQHARREKLLIEAGYDLDSWYDALPQAGHDK